MRTRDYWNKKYKQEKDRIKVEEYKTNYRQYRNLVTNMNRKGKKEYFEIMIAESKNSCSAMWKVLDKLLPGKKNTQMPKVIEYHFDKSMRT